MRHWLRILGPLLGLLAAAGSDARTWYVRPDGTGDAPTIQAAIDSAASGDSILMASGNYSENLFLSKSISLLSENGPATTIIDGGRRGRVLTIENCHEPVGPRIIGLTLRNGYDELRGGGALFGCPSTTIRESIVENNVAGSFDIGHGGGIVTAAFDCVIESNVIRNNVAGQSGGGLVASGVVRRNIITGNACHVDGGGAYFGSGGTFTENLIAGNFSDHFAGGVAINGGGDFINNTVVNNRIGATDLVAGIVIYGSGVVRNNIIARNSGAGGPLLGKAYAIWCYPSLYEETTEIDCNDVWGNDIDEIRCTNVWPNNISTNPLFCDEAGGDFRISSASPCTPSQSGCCGLIGAFPAACGVTAVESVSWTRIKSLYR